MDVYSLDEFFRKLSVIDAFSSFIWTERYAAPGDFNLVVPVTPQAVSILAEGSFLSIPESKEVMLIETQLVEKGLLKVSGSTLLNFLNERPVRSTAAHDVLNWYFPEYNRAGQVMERLVNDLCISNIAGLGMEASLNKIPDLSIGSIYKLGPDVKIAVPFGPLYDALKTLADTDSLGMSLYLDSVINGVASLKFTVYKGLDRTSTQTVNSIVRFSPALDSLTNVKELRSIVGYKTSAYAFAPAKPGGFVVPEGRAHVPGTEGITGFRRRVMLVMAEDLTTDSFGGDANALNLILAQRARDALANNNYTRVVDGEVVPQSEFKYGTHYGLGDIVELQGYSGLTQKARITEYIRTQDATGIRAYPTVSVI